MKHFIAICWMGLILSGSLHAGQFGTGFAINSKGYLVTCLHVIRDSHHILVHTSEGIQEASVVALDPANDLALIKIDKWNGRFLGLGSSDEAHYAAEVIAAGFPDPSVLGRNPKVSKGIVNALSGIRDDPRYLQISAPVQPGNSGGPVISSSGRVIGVVAAGLNSIDRMNRSGYLPQSVNYAIKTDLILRMVKDASVSIPKLGTRTQGEARQIERAIDSIALVESLKKNETKLTPSRPLRSPDSLTRSNGPWIFPDSHSRYLHPNEVGALNPEGLWRARNEIYLRRGFVFSTPRGRHFAGQYGKHYHPVSASLPDIQRQFSRVEVTNLQLIARYESAIQG